jgi:hypothetical protein
MMLLLVGLRKSSRRGFGRVAATPGEVGYSVAKYTFLTSE